jgi:putative ABC transport system ATP-binding protein
MNTLLESIQLSKSFVVGKGSERPILKDVDVQIEQGEFVAVMGPSGSGKSTLLYNISGMDKMTSGSVRFNGRELSVLSEEALAKLRLTKMGFVFQHIHLLRNLSIFDNIVLPAYLANHQSRTAINQRASALMEKVGISELAENDITQASGGQLQRVGICRALINEPDIIFGDEPTGALNSAASAEIMALLRNINQGGTTILLVTHDVKVAARADRVLFMLDGRIAAEKQLGKYAGNDAQSEGAVNDSLSRTREEALTGWLLDRGF